MEKVQRFQRLTYISKTKLLGHALIPKIEVSRFFFEPSAVGDPIRWEIKAHKLRNLWSSYLGLAIARVGRASRVA